MELSLPLPSFMRSKEFYEYMHEVLVPRMNHDFDGALIDKILAKYSGRKPKRVYTDSIMKLYRILTPANFSMGYPLVQSYNPAVRLKGDSLEMLVRMGSFNPGRTFIAKSVVDDLGKGYLNRESLIPDKSLPATLFLRARLPYESLEDPRFSPVDDEIFVVSVLRGPGLPLQDPVITWVIRDGEAAPVMYQGIVLSDNRDCFRATRKLMVIRPNYKKVPGKNVTALAFLEDGNELSDAFTIEPFIPTGDEEKTGGGFSIKLNGSEYGIVYHAVWRGPRGLLGQGTAGIYVNYLAVIDETGNLLGYTERPLTPMDYPYSGQRPGAVFASGGVILSGWLVDKILPDLQEFLRDYGRVFVLFAGIDDESIGVFVQDLDKVLEAVKWRY